MARAKTKKVNESEIPEQFAPKKRSQAKVKTNDSSDMSAEDSFESAAKSDKKECKCKCECEMGPLVREFRTYEDFCYTFAYGAYKDFCGNKEEKFSVTLKTNPMPMHVGDYQCVCVKRPIFTYKDNTDVVWFDIDVGTNGFPMGSFEDYLNGVHGIRVCPTNVEEIIDYLFAIYLEELESFDMGIFFNLKECAPTVRVSEVVKNCYYNLDNPDERYKEKMHHNQEARYVASIRLPTSGAELNNVLLIAVGMEFIRQFMAAANTAISLQHSSTIFLPHIYDIFRRNIRYEISNGYYPNGFYEVMNFVRRVSECDCNKSNDEINT